MILLINDDGIQGLGLRCLYRSLRATTRQAVLAVIPQRPQSGVSHAITLDRGLSVHPVHEDGFFALSVDGTPCDCVKLALTALCPAPPRLVVSGINDGPNVGRSLFYSGTVAAALEAAIEGFPALAVSKDRDGGSFEECANYAAGFARVLLKHHQANGLVANLNCPAAPRDDWGALRVTQHGLSGFRERLRPQRDARGRVRWTLHGTWFQRDDEEACDASALPEGSPTLSLLSPDFNLRDERTTLLTRLQRFGRRTVSGGR